MSILRLVLAFSLMTASVAALAPSAAACTVDAGPAGTVCVTDFSHETGDPTCETAGYHYGSTFGFVNAAGLARVAFAGDHSCLKSGGYQRETQQVRASAAVWGVAVLELRYTDSQQSDGDFCTADAHAYTDPTGSVDQSVPCPVGVVPILPWGDLLP